MSHATTHDGQGSATAVTTVIASGIRIPAGERRHQNAESGGVIAGRQRAAAATTAPGRRPTVVAGCACSFGTTRKSSSNSVIAYGNWYE